MFALKIYKMNKSYLPLAIVFSLLLFACSTNKEAYKIINLNIEEQKTQECDSIDIVLLSSKFDSLFFNYYQKERIDALKGQGYGSLFDWNDKNKKWIIDENDINYYKENLKKQKQVIFELNKFKNNSMFVSLVDFPIYNIYDNFQKNKEYSKRISNSHYIYTYSLPIFNKSKTNAVLTLVDAISGIRINYIYIKEKNEWKLSGKTSYSLE